MPSAISIPAVVNASMQGIASAQKDFEAWTGGLWLWEAPEYLSTVYVAKELARLEGAKFVSLENSAKSALVEAGAIARGPVHRHVRANGRFDLLLFWANESPRAPIEVKGWVKNYKSIASDMRRLNAVLHRAKDKSSFQFALMTFYTSTVDDRTFTAKEKLAKWLSNIEAEAKAILSPRTSIKLASRKIAVSGDSAWTAASILLRARDG